MSNSDSITLADVYQVYVAALMASPLLVCPPSIYFNKEDLFSFIPHDFLALLDDTGVPQVSTNVQEQIRHRLVPPFDASDKPFEEYLLDPRLLTWNDLDFCPDDQIRIGLMNSLFNLDEWVKSDGASSSVGFSYIGTKKLGFTVCFDYCIGVDFLLGDEFVTLPVVIRLYVRDSTLNMRALRCWINNDYSLHAMPTEYAENIAPFDRNHLYHFAKRFYNDKTGFYERSTGLRVMVDHGAQLFRRTVEKMYQKEVWKRQWDALSPKELSGIVTWECKMWIPDSIVFAEYWLRFPPTVPQIPNNKPILRPRVIECLAISADGEEVVKRNMVV